MEKQDLQKLVQTNRLGWFALHHRDGWWVGGEAGVTCYRTYWIARAAMTIAWQREGGRQLNFRVRVFTGADVCTGEHAPKKTALQALKDYEKGNV